MAKNILTTRLRDLVAQGVLSIAPASDGSAYQEYVLTEKGRELYVITTALRQWGEKHLYPGGKTTSTLVDREKESRSPRLNCARSMAGSCPGPTSSW